MTLAAATIERVRVKRTRADLPAARARLSYLLSSASLQPPAMPPSSILLVRTMEDPLPGRIAREFVPGALATVEWQNAARDRLGALFRGARRPLRESVPGTVEAVWFQDYGEMLACLARDLASSFAPHWWWKAILRARMLPSASAWAAVWAEEPRFIPAALEYLESCSRAPQTLARIHPEAAWRLLAATLQAFHLPDLAAVRERRSNPQLPPRGRNEAAPDWDGSTPVARDPEQSGAVLEARLLSGTAGFPWEPYVSSSSTPPELGYERQALLGVGLVLRRAPHVAATAAFRLRLHAWIRGEETRASAFAGADFLTPISSGSLRTPHSNPASGNRTPAPDSASSWPESDTLRQEPPAPGLEMRASPADGLATDFAADSRSANDRQSNSPAAVTIPMPLREWENGEFTAAGGILYLIHFVRQAELLRHFDIGLGGWALVELLARCLLDSAGKIAGDSIWDALAGLDSRAPGQPPEGFTPQPTYTAPDSWLIHESRDSAAPLRYARFRSRGVELWAPDGFVVLDSAATGNPAEASLRIGRSLRKNFRHSARVRPISLAVSPELRRFLHFVLPYARWRLGRALDGASLEDALLRKGTLYVTSTHVDLVMAMSEISLPVRLAGLDANPGWAPEFGRVITFHFT